MVKETENKFMPVYVTTAKPEEHHTCVTFIPASTPQSSTMDQTHSDGCSSSSSSELSTRRAYFPLRLLLTTGPLTAVDLRRCG